MSDEKIAKEKPENQKVTPGWYVFQDGQIKGPLSAPEAFAKRQEGKNSAERFVSRVGFQKWYPVEQVQPVLGEVEKFASESKENVQVLENVLKENMERLQQLRQQHVIPAPPVQMNQPQKKIIGPEPITPPAPVNSEETKEDVTTPGQDEIETQTVKAPDSYLTLKGRLRLGRVHSPWKAGFVNFILTLGLSWGWWFHRAFQEITYHTYNVHAHHSMARWWFCLIPGLHVYAAKRLADAVREMERQNGYQATSPSLASFLSLVPPLYIFYIQRKISAHWRLHVSFMQKQQAAAGSQSA